MLGPSACGEFMRIDFTPSTAQPFQPPLRHLDAGLALRLVRDRRGWSARCWRCAGPSCRSSTMLVGQLSPATSGRTGSSDRTARPRQNMLSSVTSPNSPEKMSMCVTPGNVSLVNCGKSSIVISPYFSFICAVVMPPLPPRAPKTRGRDRRRCAKEQVLVCPAGRPATQACA